MMAGGIPLRRWLGAPVSAVVLVVAGSLYFLVTFDKVAAAGSEAAFERYQHDIPVVFINREERFRWRVDPDELASVLKSLSG